MQAAVAVLFLVLFSLYGCGDNSTSPFAGHWTGTWVDAGLRQDGTLDLTVSGDGRVSGSVYNRTANSSGVVTGTVDNDGNIQATYDYSGTSYSSSGAVSIDSSGHLVGNVNEYFNNNLVGTASIDLVKQ